MVEGRFVADSSLHGFARRLRALGYDVHVLDGARLETVCEAARRDGRVALTLSRRVPPPCAGCRRHIVARDDVSRSVRELAARYAPSGRPFGRCVHCNAELMPGEDRAGWALAPVPPPPGARVTGQCPACHRCYWHGSHVDRMREWLERALGAPVPAPDIPPPA